MAKPSIRARREWQRLIEWYGTRLSDSHGAEPPPDWCEAIDRADAEALKRGFLVIRAKYPLHPPTFPQFAEALSPPKHHEGPQVKSTLERLNEYVLREYSYRLTPKQLRGPWTYLGKSFEALDGAGKQTQGIEITGVVIEADDTHPGFRIMVADMEGGDFQFERTG